MKRKEKNRQDDKTLYSYCPVPLSLQQHGYSPLPLSPSLSSLPLSLSRLTAAPSGNGVLITGTECLESARMDAGILHEQNK